MSLHAHFAALSTALLLAACGAKSPLAIDRARGDAGRADAGAPDSGAPDAGPSDAGPDAGPQTPCVVTPLGEDVRLELSFTAQAGAADVVLLVDTTGSMQLSIDAVEATLSSVIIPGLLQRIPNLQLAIAGYQDFAVTPYGSPLDEPLRIYQTSTADADALQLAVRRLRASGGGDGPESGTIALHQLATGAGQGRYIEPAACPGDGVGAACVRADAVSLVVMITDAMNHNGPTLGDTYAGLEPPASRYSETRAALLDQRMRVLGLFAGADTFEPDGRDDLLALAEDTGAVTEDGEPLVETLRFSGQRPIVGALLRIVERFVEEVPIARVDAFAEDVLGDADDATEMLLGVETVGSRPADGAVQHADHFTDVRPGTTVTLALRLRNDRLRPHARPRTVPVRMVLRGDGESRLTEQVFEVVVPGLDGTGQCR